MLTVMKLCMEFGDILRNGVKMQLEIKCKL